MGYMFESVDAAIEFAEDRDAAIMPVDGGYLVTEWSDYYHRISEEAGCLYDGGWRATDPDIINRLIEEYQPENNMVTCDWASAIMDKLHDIHREGGLIDLKPDCVHGFRFITLAGRHDRERIVEVLEWDADHLTRDALRNCMLSLYSHASIGDWTVHGYLERIENGWYHSTVCSMSAVTLMTIWPDKVASTEIRVNDKFIRRMGGNYAGQRLN